MTEHRVLMTEDSHPPSRSLYLAWRRRTQPQRFASLPAGRLHEHTDPCRDTPKPAQTRQINAVQVNKNPSRSGPRLVENPGRRGPIRRGSEREPERSAHTTAPRSKAIASPRNFLTRSFGAGSAHLEPGASLLVFVRCRRDVRWTEMHGNVWQCVDDDPAPQKRAIEAVTAPVNSSHEAAVLDKSLEGV